MDLTVIKWLTNNQDQQETLLKLVVWIGEYVFWNLLKSFCHVTEKAIGRKEIFFYHKRDFQKLANKSFHHFTLQKTLALVDKNFRPKLLVLSGNPTHRIPLIDFGNLITKKLSLLICSHVLTENKPKNVVKLKVGLLSKFN